MDPVDPGQPTEALRVDNFVRPFVQKAAQKLVEEHGGGIAVKGFWMDSIKTHCYTVFESLDCAEKAQKGLNGLKWPEMGRNLIATFVSTEEAWSFINQTGEFKARASARASAAPAGRQQETGQQPDNQVAAGSDLRKKLAERGRNDERVRPAGGRVERDEVPTLEKLFRKTTTKPCIYWLPLTDAQVEAKKKGLLTVEQLQARHTGAVEQQYGSTARNSAPPPSHNRDQGQQHRSFAPRGGYRGRDRQYAPRGGGYYNNRAGGYRERRDFDRR